MHGSAAANAELVAGIVAGAPGSDRVQLLVCPPFPYLAAVCQAVGNSGVTVGAQSVSQYASGAYTGEVAISMLADVGCRYVIVGHSERRTLFGETSQQVAEKFKAVLEAGLIPILCVGETLSEREAGATEAVVDEQLGAAVDAVGIDAFANAVVAYEPVWAIGTGVTATPEQAQAVHEYLRGRIASSSAAIAESLQLLYGGSMKGDNASGLLAMPDIDGGLIGGASLQAERFLAIARAAAEV
jgi:triosephosphate isomerase